MFCPNCGKQNEDSARFCYGCGTVFENAAQQPQQPVQPQYQAPQQPQYQAPQQPQYQAPQQPVYPAQQPAVPGKGLAITSMVLGIVALVFCCIWYLGIPCAIVGAVLGGIAYSKAKAVGMKSGMAVAGLVCSCIALGLNILVIILAAIGLASLGFL